MIKVFVETNSAFVRYKDVDRVEITENQLIVYIGCSFCHYDLDKLLSYEIRKDKNNV